MEIIFLLKNEKNKIKKLKFYDFRAMYVVRESIKMQYQSSKFKNFIKRSSFVEWFRR